MWEGVFCAFVLVLCIFVHLFHNKLFGMVELFKYNILFVIPTIFVLVFFIKNCLE